MIPTSFHTQYPRLTQVLVAMGTTGAQDTPEPQAAWADVAKELASFNQSGAPLDELASSILAGALEPERELARFSASAYRHLGVSDDVRAFMGRLWATALRPWSTQQRARFLELTVEDRHQAFEALDFTAVLFTHTSFTSDEILPWLTRARLQVGNDLLQHGMWSSVQAFCKRSPTEGVHVAMAWLDAAPDAQSLATIANITGWVRLELIDGDPSAAELAALEDRLRTSANPAWRSAFIQSWARAVEQGLLTHEKVRELFDDFVTKDSDEEVAWCYLLHAIVQRESVTIDEWSWISIELRRVARLGLASAAQYWIVLTVLKGLSDSRTQGAAQVSGWLDLFQMLCPIPSANQQTWSRITGTVVELAKTAPEIMRGFVIALATHSGRQWLECEDRNEFRWFLTELVKHNQHDWTASQLCFRPGTYSRRLGLRVFDECKVLTLEPQSVTTASKTQVELLLLEARRFHVGYGALARLHGSLAVRVDQLAGELPELLYDEVSRQCRNTHAYRAALRAAAPANEYLMAIVDDSEERMKETRDSFASPALQMDVRGYSRARRLHDRYVARLVAKGVAEKSVFLSLVRKVQLLYTGEKWRHINPDGSLSESSAFHTTSTEIEVPQLEMANPEEAQMRRVQASAHIARLEQETSAQGNE